MLKNTYTFKTNKVLFVYMYFPKSFKFSEMFEVSTILFHLPLYVSDRFEFPVETCFILLEEFDWSCRKFKDLNHTNYLEGKARVVFSTSRNTIFQLISVANTNTVRNLANTESGKK